MLNMLPDINKCSVIKSSVPGVVRFEINPFNMPSSRLDVFSPPIIKCFRITELFMNLIDNLDAQSIIRLGRTCKEFQSIIELAWNFEGIFCQFVDNTKELRNEFKRSGATATGEYLIEFFDRQKHSKCLDLSI